MLLSRLYLQMGTYLDYYTGEHNPSLSYALRSAHLQREGDTTNLEDFVPPRHRPLFPHMAVNSSWPPTFLAHGSNDSAVLVEESQNMHRLLEQSGVKSMLRVIDNAEHSLDYVPDAEEIYGKPGGLFDEILDFLLECL